MSILPNIPQSQCPQMSSIAKRCLEVNVPAHKAITVNSKTNFHKSLEKHSNIGHIHTSEVHIPSTGYNYYNYVCKGTIDFTITPSKLKATLCQIY